MVQDAQKRVMGVVLGGPSVLSCVDLGGDVGARDREEEEEKASDKLDCFCVEHDEEKIEVESVDLVDLVNLVDLVGLVLLFLESVKEISCRSRFGNT